MISESDLFFMLLNKEAGWILSHLPLELYNGMAIIELISILDYFFSMAVNND